MAKTSKPKKNKPRLNKDHLSKEVEARLSAFVNSSTEGFALLDENLDYMFINPVAERMIGVSREAVVGKNIMDVVPDVRESGRYEKYVSILETGEPLHIEDVVSHTKFRDIHASLKAFRVENWLGLVFTDITERKRAEETLRDSEERFRSILENAPFGYYRVEKDGLWQYVNPVWERMHGFSLGEVIGKPFEITQTKDAVEQSKDLVKRALAGEAIAGEFSRLRKDGDIEYHSFNIQPVKRGNEIVAIEGFISDITERKQAEEALRESEERNRALVEAAGKAGECIGIVQTVEGLEAAFVFVNDEFCRVVGYSREELLSMKAQDVIHPAEFSEILDRYRRRQKGENVPALYELTLVRKDGNSIPVEAGFGIMTYAGEVATVAFLRDTTERKKAEEQERRHSHDLDLLSKAAMALVELRPDADIHHFIAERLQGFAEGSAVLVNSFDEASGTFCLREALGIGGKMEELTRILGFNLIGMRAPISDEARQGLSLAELVGVRGGVYDLASGALPMPACQEIERLLDVSSVYGIGLAWEGRLAGSAAIFMRNKTRLRNKDVIETFVRQASVALQRRQAEEVLKESEEKYRALIEATGRAGEGIIIIQDREEREAAFVFVNDEFCKMSGYAREELLNRSAWDLVPYEIAVRLKDWYKLRHMGEALPGHYEAAGVRKDGTIVPLDLSVVTMPWQGKIATVLYMRDITERKRMDEALRESEQTIRRLAKASASAHEEERQRVSLEVHDRISQTLTGAFHQLQALESIPMENTGAQQILKRASALLQESIRESRNIIEDLYSPVLSDFGIVAVIDEELRRFREETGCGTKFDKKFAVRPIPDVELTAYRIFREVIANIKRHAIGATEVRVSLSCEAGVVSLQVKDNGPGFDVKAAMLNKRVGGLKGMQRRAELGGGTFEVISSRGHGTTVTVRLPYSSEAPAADVGKEEKTT